MKSIITFTPMYEVEEENYPQPAQKLLPEWYKNTSSYTNSNHLEFDENENINTTIKKCIPVFDSLCAGYILKTPLDVHVSLSKEGYHMFRWPDRDMIRFQSIKQADKYPIKNSQDFPKWINPWSIKTKNGYSCLFIDPMHNPNGIFTILPAIVDTDTYDIPINFPFIMNDRSFTGIIPAGTNIAQVIPFKRDSFTMKIGSNAEDIAKRRRVLSYHMINRYKNKYWHRKEYK